MWLNEYTYKKPTGNGSSRMGLFFFFFFLLPPSFDSLQISASIFHLSVDRMQLSAAPIMYYTSSGSSDRDGHFFLFFFLFYVKGSCLLGTLPRPSHTLSSEASPVSIGQVLWGNGFASRESGISGVSVASCVSLAPSVLQGHWPKWILSVGWTGCRWPHVTGTLTVRLIISV